MNSLIRCRTGRKVNSTAVVLLSFDRRRDIHLKVSTDVTEFA